MAAVFQGLLVKGVRPEGRLKSRPIIPPLCHPSWTIPVASPLEADSVVKDLRRDEGTGGRLTVA